MPKPKKSLEERFWQKVNKTETCWLWTAAKHFFGYGLIGCPDKPKRILRAHRASWEMAFGPIPKGLYVLHKCDVPSCVNPDHLFLGTHQQNVDDMVRKGRNAKTGNGSGENSPNSKLTWCNVKKIRSDHAQGSTLIAIAEQYKMHPTTIAQIVKHKTWKEKDHEN